MTPIRLSQLTQGIALLLEEVYKEKRFWVIADITSHTFREEKGYHNFELVEKDINSSNVIARISGKSWGNGAKQIASFEQITGQRFTNNIQVLVLVALEYHTVFGISASILDIDPNFTLGALEQQRNATLERLIAQNDFINKVDGEYKTANKELTFNRVIQNIAHLSSSVSAGAEDFRHTLLHNSYGYTFRIDDYFASVQGDKNAGQFLDKLIEIYTSAIQYDAVVITRGGGSQTDFLIFDNYRIARAVAKFPIPIITGIGHQKNQSITDMMIHTQTKTPTKAAEWIIAHNRTFEEALLIFQKEILITSQRLLSKHTVQLSDTKQAILHKTKTLLVAHDRDLLQAGSQLSTYTKLTVQQRKNDLKTISMSLQRTPVDLLKNQKLKIENYNTAVRLMSPLNILSKGYAILRMDGKIVSNTSTIEKGTTIEIVLSDATLHSTVTKKTKHDGTTNNDL